MYKTEMHESILIPKKLFMYKKKRGITLQPTNVCDRIFIFLFVALCLLASISDLFLHLHHQGIDILVTLCAIPSTISWWWSEQPEDWIHPKSTVFLMAATVYSSTEYVWATSAIILSNTVTDTLTVSTSLNMGWGSRQLAIGSQRSQDLKTVFLWSQFWG